MSFAVSFADQAKLLLEHSPEEASVPELQTPSLVERAAVEDALARGETHYTDRPGVFPLRVIIAALLQEKFEITVDARTELTVTCGLTEARFVSVQQLLQPADTLAAPVCSDCLFGAALLRRVTLVTSIGPDVRVVYLRSSMPEAMLRSHLAEAPAVSSILYEVDDHNSRFHPAQISGFAKRTVTIGDLGEKSWRVGFLACPNAASPGMRDFKQALTICSTNLSQWAALAMLEPR